MHVLGSLGLVLSNVMHNVFTFRSTDQSDLEQHGQPCQYSDRGW